MKGGQRCGAWQYRSATRCVAKWEKGGDNDVLANHARHVMVIVHGIDGVHRRDSRHHSPGAPVLKCLKTKLFFLPLSALRTSRQNELGRTEMGVVNCRLQHRPGEPRLQMFALSTAGM